MASVESRTRISLDELINATVVSGHVSGSGRLLLTTRGGAEIDAGNVRFDASGPTAHAPALGLWFPDLEGAVGDGVTDDSVALQTTLNMVKSAGGGFMHLEAGKNYAFASTLDVPFPGGIRGVSRAISKMTYTGTTTALRTANWGTAEQKLNFKLVDFDLLIPNCTATTIGIHAKGMCHGVIDIYLSGVATNATIPAGSIGLLVDASYGPSVGAWWNKIISHIRGFDTCIKFFGYDGNGQANENIVGPNARLGWYGKGVWVETGDHVTVRDSELSASSPGAIGVYTQDEMTRVLNCRFESVAEAVRLAAADASHPGGRRAVIEHNIFSSGGVVIEAGVTTGPRIGPNYWASGVGVIDNMANQQNFSAMARYSDRSLIPLTFTLPAIAANTTYNDLTVLGGTAAKDLRYYLGHPYQIRGVSARLSSSVSAGSITITPKVGTTPSSTLSLTLSSGSAGSMYQGMSKDTNNGTNSVQCQVVTDAAYSAAAGQTMIVTVWVEATD